jgi:hypothetical protein
LRFGPGLGEGFVVVVRGGIVVCGAVERGSCDVRVYSTLVCLTDIMELELFAEI